MNQLLTTCRVAAAVSALAASAAVHATFSIVAFDPNTREVGSAMATCVSNIDLGFFASRFAPGQGAINAQSFASVPNLLNGRERLLMGDSAQETLDFLLANDVNNDPQSRQYLIVDLGDNAFDHSVTFSGADNFAFAGGVDGDNYAIAGNILSGEDIILQMETAFLNTDGWLGEKLMAALQGAKEPMADQRCPQTSSLSAYISVTRADDALDDEFMRLDERAPNSITEPIDLLQSAFDDFVAANLTDDSDADGVPDLLDNCRTVSNPMQTDADGDQYGNACDGDLSNDCATNAADLGIFRTLFFGADSAADFNEDGVVNVADLGLLRTLFFSAPGPSGLTNDCNM